MLRIIITMMMWSRRNIFPQPNAENDEYVFLAVLCLCYNPTEMYPYTDTSKEVFCVKGSKARNLGSWNSYLCIFYIPFPHTLENTFMSWCTNFHIQCYNCWSTCCSMINYIRAIIWLGFLLGQRSCSQYSVLCMLFGGVSGTKVKTIDITNIPYLI